MKQKVLERLQKKGTQKLFGKTLQVFDKKLKEVTKKSSMKNLVWEKLSLVNTPFLIKSIINDLQLNNRVNRRKKQKKKKLKSKSMRWMVDIISEGMMLKGYKKDVKG